jgi:hypothetical protein
MTTEKKARAASYFIAALFFLFVQASLGEAQNWTKLPQGFKQDSYISALDKIFGSSPD